MWCQAFTRGRAGHGHGFSLRGLAWLQEEAAAAALWTSLRVLKERQAVLRRLAQAREPAMPDIAPEAQREADALADLCRALGRPSKTHTARTVLTDMLPAALPSYASLRSRR